MSHLCRISVSLIKKVRKKAKSIKMIPATPEPKLLENGPEPEFRPEFRRNFEPRPENSPQIQAISYVLPRPLLWPLLTRKHSRHHTAAAYPMSGCLMSDHAADA